MQPARDESREAESVAVPLRGARLERGDVALDVIMFREEFEPRQAARVQHELLECSPESARRDVVQHTAADHKVESFRKFGVQGELIKRLDRTTAQPASRPESPDCILTWFHAHIPQVRSHRRQDGLPMPFARTDIEHSANRSIEHVLRGSEREADDASDLRRCAHTMLTIAIPLVEIRLVVRHGLREGDHCGALCALADSHIVTSAMTEADRVALRARLVAALPAQWRTRFAPAPTGMLHMGHAVNAVFVWSIARAFGGAVLLRIEDHDARRASESFDAGIRSDLAWLGLRADNAALGYPDTLRQRGNESAYEGAVHDLTARQLLYACRCSRRDITAAQNASTNVEPRYPGTCRNLGVPFIETAARRVRLDPMTVTFDDLRHGPQSQTPQQQCGDLLVRDRHAQWTYQFAVVVDDLRQNIDVVIRGDDLLASTGRQWQLATLLDRASPPMVLHHPLVTREDGAKLSKSHGDTGLAELRDAGWSAARALGHAAWLGGLQATPRDISAEELAHLWTS